MTATSIRQTIKSWSLVLIASTSLSTGCGSTESSNDYIPSFDRIWRTQQGDSFSFNPDKTDVSSGNLTGEHTSPDGQFFTLGGTFSGREIDLSAAEDTALTYQGRFTDDDHIAMNRSDGKTYALIRSLN